MWTADHEAAFSTVKEALSHPPQLMFDPDLPTILLTHTTHLNSIGYTLLQDHGGNHFHLVQCALCFLFNAVVCYATTELEMLAAVWAMHKCSYFLKGLHQFEYVMDHRLLIPILNNYTLKNEDNFHLQHLKRSYHHMCSLRSGTLGRCSIYQVLCPATHCPT